MNIKSYRDISRKLRVFEYVDKIGKIARKRRYFGISRETFCRCKWAYGKYGEKVLIDNRCCSESNIHFLLNWDKLNWSFLYYLIWELIMKKSLFTETQIIATLRKVDAGMKVDDVCRQ